jgi:hypothetical protein
MFWHRRLIRLVQKRHDEVRIALAACPVALQAGAPVVCAVGSEVQVMRPCPGACVQAGLATPPASTSPDRLEHASLP